MMWARATWQTVLFVFLLGATEARSYGKDQGGPGTKRPLENLTIEELLELEVDLVSRRPEVLEDSPAAIYVITAEDIARSGATSVPELLRVVPGVQVTRTNTTV